ncbi:MAG: hypothetical protein CFH33_01027 [Alphaproteobacteria bacterium MarineAlpha9_Bin3]|nr:MAG: hypothetical protein CFH33_01027 [Alphaproteobacteria bacterium MarineAlpha9_Bin3]
MYLIIDNNYIIYKIYYMILIKGEIMGFINKIYKLLIIISLTFIMTKSIFAEEFGTKDEALFLLDRAVALVNLNRDRALELFTSGEGGLHPKDLYPFCLNDEGLLVAHPTNVGMNVMDFEDVNGKLVGKSIIKVAKYGSINEVDFMIARLTTKDDKLYKKNQLVTRVANLICVVGYYTE